MRKTKKEKQLQQHNTQHNTQHNIIITLSATMFGVIANRAAFVGKRAIAVRSLATVGSQVPSVVLHS
jgi:hypothetical protein